MIHQSSLDRRPEGSRKLAGNRPVGARKVAGRWPVTPGRRWKVLEGPGRLAPKDNRHSGFGSAGGPFVAAGADEGLLVSGAVLRLSGLVPAAVGEALVFGTGAALFP